MKNWQSRHGVSGLSEPKGQLSMWVSMLYPNMEMPHIKSGYARELLSKLLVSPLMTPTVVPHIIPYVAPFKEFRL